MNTSQKIPVLLITGFLGSGKTTFINWLLEQNPDTPISLILNEFGDVALESKFISRQNADVAELSNGCLCHAAKGDVPRAVKYILENSPQTQHLVIEASGLSYPDLVKDVLNGPELANLISFDMTVCVVDGQNFLQTYQQEPLIVSQLADADVGLFSKVSLVEASVIEETKQTLTNLMPQLRLLEFTDQLSSDLFLDQQLPTMQKNQPKHEHSEDDHDHQHEYNHLWFDEPMALDLRKLTDVMRSWPASIVRAKGSVTSYHPETHKRLHRLVSFVAGRFSFLPVTDEQTLKQPDDRSTLVVIGKEIDTNMLAEQLRGCEMEVSQ